jgi:CheY-like chemotaxis protein
VNVPYLRPPSRSPRAAPALPSVNEPLDSPVDAGQAVRHERVDLVRLVRTAVDARREAFARAGVALELEERGEMLCVDGDASRLRAEIDALIGDPAAFSANPGAAVRVARQDGQVVVTVGERQSGPARAPSSAICLPLAHEPPALAADPRAARDDADKGLRVLLIEDNRDAADTLRMLLDFAGHDVSVAYRGDEGFEAAVDEKPDVVVSDIGLPGMDGYAIARELRKRGDMAGTRLIAVTGYGQDENLKLAAESGFEACFVKPVDPMRLLSQLSRGE